MAPRPAVKISVPDANMDRPASRRLALIAGVCFLCGVFWPSLAKLDFVQRPPGTPPPKADDAETAPNDGDPEPPLPSPPKDSELLVPAARAEPNLTPSETATLEQTLITSCHEAGKRIETCDELKLEPLMRAPLAGLATCKAADGAAGVLSLGVELDFARGRVTRVKAGKSTTLPSDIVEPLITCAEQTVVGTQLSGVEHRYTSYWVYHLVRFHPPGSSVDPSAPDPNAVVSASGRGTIGWKTAIVREAPSRQAKTAARLLYGTRVNVTGRAGDWYRIDYDGRGSVGWVHRKAIGM